LKKGLDYRVGIDYSSSIKERIGQGGEGESGKGKGKKLKKGLDSPPRK